MNLRGVLYYGGHNYVDRLWLANYTFRDRFFFGGYAGEGPGTVSAMAIDAATEVAYVTSYNAENANDLFAVSLQPAPPHPNQPLDSSPQVLIGAVVVVVVVTFSAGSYLVWKRTVGKRLG